MQPDVSLVIVALLALPLAVVAVVAAVVVGRAAWHQRTMLRRQAGGIEHATDQVRLAIPRLRRDVECLTGAVEAARTGGRRLDRRLEVLTADLATTRSALERLSRGRLAPAVRAVRLASTLTRVALLWRAPTR